MRERDLFLAALDFEDPEARIAHLKAECGEDLALLARVQSLLASHDAQGQFLNRPVAQQIADGADTESAVTMLVGSGSTQEAVDDVRGDDNGLDATTAFKNNGPDKMRKHTEEGWDDGWTDEIPLGYLQPATKPNSLGRLGHYEVLEVVGRGAFGTVLRAFDEKLQRVVAIKVLSPEMAATSPARKRFLREARTSAAIRHENVVAIHAVEDEPIPYLVMEYIPGQTLQQRLDKSGPLPVIDVLKLGKQIADGLAAAHAQDLIHRDIKPGNILLEGGVSERVKITDFGLARTADDASVTQSGLIAGTPMYMAPEQAMGLKLDQRADLFSLGSVLYQMLSGRPPFRAANTVAVLKRVVDDTPRPIQEIIPEVPTWMCELIGQLHAKNPDERIQTAKEVSDLLGGCLDELKAGRVPKIPCHSHRTAETLEHSPLAVSRSDQLPRQEGLRRSSVGKGTVVALVLLGLIGITEATGVTKFVSTVSRLRTNSGTQVVEPADPDVKVAIKANAVPFSDADVSRITALPPAEQVEEVRNELMRRNPGFDGTIRHKVEGDVVSDIKFVTDRVTDIAPLRVFNSLKTLDLGGSHTNFHGNGQLADLSPLAGMNLTGLTKLELSWTKVTDADLVHFRDSKKLTFLGLGETKVTNAGLAYFKDCKELQQLELFKNKPLSDEGLAHFKDCKNLTRLQLAETSVSDAGLSVFGDCTLITELFLQGNKQFTEAGLVHFQNCKLKTLLIKQTSVRDLTVLRSWPLNLVVCDFQAARDTEILRSIATLETINDKPVAEFFKAAGTSRNNSSAVQSPADAPRPAIAPFDAEQAKAHQEAWAKHLGVPVEYTNSIGMKFRLIPPGEFLMGAPDTDADATPQEKPQHQVRLTKPFAIGATEVTTRQFRQFVEATKYVTEAESDGQGAFDVNSKVRRPSCTWDSAEFKKKTADEHAVRCVSKEDASRFCEWLTQTEGRVYRLPSEAEWEFACRAGTTTRYSFGNNFADTPSPPGVSGAAVRPVAQLPANPFGLFDMHGSVHEICRDSGRTFTAEPVTDPIGRIDKSLPAVVRSGAISANAARLRSSNRYLNDARQFPELNFATAVIGFRVVAEYKPPLSPIDAPMKR